MKKIIKSKNLFAVAAGVVIAAASTLSNATAGAVIVNGFDGNDNAITSGGDSISATSQSGINSSYSVPSMNYSAGGFMGSWFAFMTSGGVYDVTVSANTQTLTGTFSPGITVWASGANPFNGGSMIGWTETSSSGHNTPISFNATSPIGSPGTDWMSSGQGGNLIETLGYANSGPNHTNGSNIFTCIPIGCPPSTSSPTGWGENIMHGAHDVSVSNIFESGVSGSVGSGFAQLTFNDLQPGWYTVFVGGTNPAQTGALYDLTVSAAAVPEMETWAMMLAGIGFLGWRMKKQQQEMTAFSA
jgi:hypothetical protein